MEDKVKEEDLTWASVSFDDPEEVKRFEEQELRRAGERIRKAVKELQDLGIVDKDGELVDKTLPPDMQPDSECDL